MERAGTTNPFEGLISQNEINSVFEDASRRRKRGRPPQARAFVEGGDLVVVVGAPGARPEDVLVDVEDGVLRVTVKGGA